MIKPIRFLTTIECAEGGSIGIYESEGGLPIIRTHDAIAGHVVNVEIRDSQELTTLRKALNEFYGGLRCNKCDIDVATRGTEVLKRRRG
jgi:hypothetical protein